MWRGRDRPTLNEPLSAASETPRKALYEHGLAQGRGQSAAVEGSAPRRQGEEGNPAGPPEKAGGRWHWTVGAALSLLLVRFYGV